MKATKEAAKKREGTAIFTKNILECSSPSTSATKEVSPDSSFGTIPSSILDCRASLTMKSFEWLVSIKAVSIVFPFSELLLISIPSNARLTVVNVQLKKYRDTINHFHFHSCNALRNILIHIKTGMRNHDHVLTLMMMIFTHWSDQCFPIFSPGAFSPLLLQNILVTN